MSNSDLMDKIVALAKRRGFAFQDAEIYGGLANTWTYGPLGTEILRNLRNLWWQKFVHARSDILGTEAPILTNPKVWEASGHTQNFNEAVVECKNCHQRFRTDHLIEDFLTEVKVEGLDNPQLDRLIQQHQIPCPNCQQINWTPSRKFNQLFQTRIGVVEETESTAYLRGETAQGMFVNLKTILDAMHPKLPFGIAQIGRAFRNEFSKGNFIFRTLEFEQMEIEYFISPTAWEKSFEEWKQSMWQWLIDLGIDEKKLRWRQHTQQELAHYSQRTEDIEYDFPFGGYKELYGLAYRTDFDLKNHMQKSGVDLRYFDPDTKQKFIPHVIEPTFGLNRTLLVLLLDTYREQGDRTWLAFKPQLAPYQIAVFPLLRNKPELVKVAQKVFRGLKPKFRTIWDDRGNIGKRYYSQDEIGTPWCVTIDFQTLEDQTVTVRERDTTEQKRYKSAELVNLFQNKLEI